MRDEVIEDMRPPRLSGSAMQARTDAVITRKQSLIEVGYRISALRNFLDRVSADAIEELEEIKGRCGSGQIADYLDYEHQTDFPFARVEIATRAVAYEVVALVEAQLQALAEAPWRRSLKSTGLKRIADIPHPNPESLATLKVVSGLPFPEIVRLVEQEYRIKMADLPGWQQLQELRDLVNSFKHRSGWKRPDQINWWQKDHDISAFKNELGFDEASSNLNAASDFLRALNGLGGGRPQQ